MLYKSSDLIGRAIHATDGHIGSVDDLLFDDSSWRIRWAVIDTGSWLPGRKVLLPPIRLQTEPGDDHAFAVNLTREQIRNCPDTAEDLPVSRHHEALLYAYYQWDPYWLAPVATDPTAPLLTEQELPPGNPHLRSVTDTEGTGIHATDGDIGSLKRLLIDPQDWAIRALEIDTGHWLPGRKVLVAPASVQSIDGDNPRIQVKLTCDQVERSPEYDPDQPIDQAQMKTTYRHYDLPIDWR